MHSVSNKQLAAAEEQAYLRRMEEQQRRRELRGYLRSVKFPQKSLRCSVEVQVKEAAGLKTLFLVYTVNGFKDRISVPIDQKKVDYLGQWFPQHLLSYIGDLVTSENEDPACIELTTKYRNFCTSLPKSTQRTVPRKQGGWNRGKSEWPLKRSREALQLYDVFTSKIEMGEPSLGPRPTDGAGNRSGKLSNSEWAYRLTRQQLNANSDTYVARQIRRARAERKKRMARRKVA